MIVYSKVSQQPGSMPVTLEEAKIHLRIDPANTDEDTYITSLLAAAVRVCESYAGLSFITQTRIVKLDGFAGNDVVLPYGPVTEVTEFTYIDEDDTEQPIDGADYILDTQSGVSKIRVSDSWPFTNRSLNNVAITYTAGYGDVDAVPEVAKLAIKRRLAYLYENRGDSSASEDTVWMDLLDTIKVYWDAEY